MGEKEKRFLCLFMTLTTGAAGETLHSVKAVFCMDFVCFCFFAISKELIPNVCFIYNQHPFYVRWGDKNL